MLPNATLEQKIATGFNRNHVLTTEGGIIEDEYRVEYVADRVHTTSSVFLGLSLGCARCHDHKYDPISQKEYYQFFAFFNNLPDKTVPYSKTPLAPEPAVKVVSPSTIRNASASWSRCGWTCSGSSRSANRPWPPTWKNGKQA